jgi:hypothetical protein
MEPKRSQKKSAGAVIAHVGAVIFVVGLLFCACMYVVAPKNNPSPYAGFLEGLMVLLVGVPILVIGCAVFLIGLVMQFTQRWDRNFRIRHQRKPGDRVRDTPQGLKPRSFCLSRVVGTLRNAAWPRLGEYRSGQGKTETGHPSMPTVSWAVPGPLLLSCLSEREEWPTPPVFGAWRAVTPASFDAAPLGTSPKGGGFSLMLFL